jgi:hypothetical protein
LIYEEAIFMMQRIIQHTALTALLLALVIPASVDANEADQVWLKSELVPFKQRIAPARELISSERGPIIKEEWERFSANVLIASKLNEPISTSNWATLMKLSVCLPEDKDQLTWSLQAYIYAFDQGSHLSREDAVGGMVKLLSLRSLHAASQSDDPDPRQTLNDASEVSDEQQSLFHIAYREGILDSSVKDQFRPKALLTHREAVSMAYRIIQKYGIPIDYDVLWPDQHWSSEEVKSALRSYPSRLSFQQITSFLVKDSPTSAWLDQPIDADAWRRMLLTIGVPRSNTFQQAAGKSVERSAVIDDLIKLYGPEHDATSEEMAQLEAYFADAADASDKNALAMAANLGWVKGDEDGLFHPKRSLTYAEAYTLAARVSSYLSKIETR